MRTCSRDGPHRTLFQENQSLELKRYLEQKSPVLRGSLFGWSLVVVALIAASGCKPNSADHIRLAKNAVFEKKPDEALREYRLALDRLETDTSPPAQVFRARALRGAADVYYLELRDMRHAVEVYRELIQLCPDAAETLDARLHLADILRAQFHDLRGAIQELKGALARNPPQGAELNYQIAKLYFELADYQQADLEAQSLVKKFETSAFVDDALFLRAQALGMMEARRVDAMRGFQELADRFPDSELHAHALFELGKLRAENGEPEKAIETWVEALKKHPDPVVVQGAIAKVRRHLVATNVDYIGKHDKVFDHGAAYDKGPARKNHKTSVEAVGGSAEEAAKELGTSHAAADQGGMSATAE